ncbi:hypothetical protein BLNAU_10312 [Blattamonas nauphoetae]|uniref:FHA domain-containing protein n=1 Tax=Blattamonas nauphoetae TaxID=2049346 RepID=A0ABQ9XT51_9EUKA|nr:hypothetical protein BLNAU_10312 [Blattamonas nauphoetae]
MPNRWTRIDSHTLTMKEMPLQLPTMMMFFSHFKPNNRNNSCASQFLLRLFVVDHSLNLTLGKSGFHGEDAIHIDNRVLVSRIHANVLKEKSLLTVRGGCHSDNKVMKTPQKFKFFH